MRKLSVFETAGNLLSSQYKGYLFDGQFITYGDRQFAQEGQYVINNVGDAKLPLLKETNVGDICQYVYGSLADGPAFPPTQLKGNGKEFEELILLESARLERSGIMTLSRYGTQVHMIGGRWIPVPSYPDFEGVDNEGRQIIIEAKVCSSSCFRIQKDKIKPRQVSHMLRRSRFGARCFVLIHFNARFGKTYVDLPITVAIPVCGSDDGGWQVWEDFAESEIKKKEFEGITRESAQKLGHTVAWHVPDRSEKKRPDIGELLRL